MGKSLMADPERAPLVRRAFEEYATGRFTKEQLLNQARAWGLTNRRGRPLKSQAIGVLLRNQLYAGIVDVAEYGVRGKRGDFDPLISEDLFYRVQSVLSGRMPSTTPKQRAHPDFPVRVGCRRFTGSQVEGRSVSRFEMTLGKSAARAGFQVALEVDGTLPIRELDDNVNLPRSSRDRVGAAPRVVVGQPTIHIGREADVEVWLGISVPEDVDKPLVSRHARAKATDIPTHTVTRMLAIPGSLVESVAVSARCVEG